MYPEVWTQIKGVPPDFRQEQFADPKNWTDSSVNSNSLDTDPIRIPDFGH